MIGRIKEQLIKNYTNSRGFKTNRKIVVFESDDWGSIMMKNQNSFDRLLNKGIPVDNSKYSKLDCLETRKDILDLFEVLSSHKTEGGLIPNFTFNTVMENPDFTKIKESNFNSYFGESFNDSYKKYYNEDNMDVWHQGIREGIMMPQFHAKEHFNRFFWMQDLKNKNKDTLTGFENSFFGMGLKTSSSIRKRYLPTYFAETASEHLLIQENLKNGLEEFKKLFGFDSKTFIASNYTWSPELEPTLNQAGVEGIQGSRVQLAPDLKSGKLKKIRRFTGEKNKFNQIYTVRNVSFEPYSNPQIDWVSYTIKDIENAFFWGKPAIVETHRINYVSSMSLRNKENNLKLLDIFLKTLINKYPEIEFITSDSLVKLIREDQSI